MADINYAAIQKAIDRLKRAVTTNLFEVFPVYSEENKDRASKFADRVMTFNVSNKYIDVWTSKYYYDKGTKVLYDAYDFLPSEIEGFTLDLLTSAGGVWKRVHLQGRLISDEEKERREKLKEKFPHIDTNKEEALYMCSYNPQHNKEDYYHFVYEFYGQTIEMCNLETNRNR